MSWEITLLYFFSWNFISFGQKEPIKVQNFRLLNAHVKFHQNFYFDRLLLLKVYKISAKNVQKSYVSWHWRAMQKLEKNWFVASKMTRICWILTQALKSLKKIWTLIGSFYAKYIMFDLKSKQRSYLTWHWRMMQNLNKYWLVVWKMTWKIW